MPGSADVAVNRTLSSYHRYSQFSGGNDNRDIISTNHCIKFHRKGRVQDQSRILNQALGSGEALQKVGEGSKGE